VYIEPNLSFASYLERVRAGFRTVNKKFITTNITITNNITEPEIISLNVLPAYIEFIDEIAYYIKPACIVFITKFQQSVLIILSINFLNREHRFVVTFLILNNKIIANNIATIIVPNIHIP
jgi:hypothetical protein